MATPVSPLFAGLVDDAAVFPPGNAALPDAVTAHRAHRTAWYRDLVGPLLVPASQADRAAALLGPGELLRIGLIADNGIDGIATVLESGRFEPGAGLDARGPDAPARSGAFAGPGPATPGVGAAGSLVLAQVEVAVAKRGEDPLPGLARLADLVAARRLPMAYAEIPFTWGLFGALDALAASRERGLPIAAKFRTGGLAAELFPSPAELAAVMCGCRDRQVPFKLTAGLHHAIRHADAETGFVQHGFVNVLVAALVAGRGGTVHDVTAILAGTDPVPLVREARQHRTDPRPLWIGFGSCSIAEPLTDLTRLGLIDTETA